MKLTDSFLFSEGFWGSIAVVALVAGLLGIFGYITRLANSGMFQVKFSDGHKLVCRYVERTNCGMTYDKCDDKVLHQCTVNSFYEEIK